MRVLGCSLALVSLAFVSCVIGAPPGFSGGDIWVAPLVNPLDDDTLLVPVTINGKGPYLFMIDPDLGSSAVDSYIQSEADLYPRQTLDAQNFDDTLKKITLVEAREIGIGNLTVSNRVLMVLPTGPFEVGGRMVRGVLGRDVIANSLLFGIDRDRGVIHLATKGNLAPPANSFPVEFRYVAPHNLAKIKINDGKTLTVHLRLGSSQSQLWENRIEALALPKIPEPQEVRDQFGFTKERPYTTLSSTVELGGVRAEQIRFTPFDDKRFTDMILDGELGQNFFSKFHVTADWHHKTIHLKRRSGDLIGTASERMRRWGDQFKDCKLPACVEVALEPVGPGTTAPPKAAATVTAGECQAAVANIVRIEGDGGTVDVPAQVKACTALERPMVHCQINAKSAEDLAQCAGSGNAAADAAAVASADKPLFWQLQIKREPQAVKMNYEILLVAVNSEGADLGLPPLRASLTGELETIFHRITDERYADAAAFLVLDMSAFPRPCEKLGQGYRCVW